MPTATQLGDAPTAIMFDILADPTQHVRVFHAIEVRLLKQITHIHVYPLQLQGCVCFTCTWHRPGTALAPFLHCPQRPKNSLAVPFSDPSRPFPSLTIPSLPSMPGLLKHEIDWTMSH